MKKPNVPSSKRPFLMIPKDMAERMANDDDFEDGALILYGWLEQHSHKFGHAKTFNPYLSKLLGVSESTIGRWLKQLSDRKYIRVDLRRNEGNKRRIYIIDPIVMDDDTPIPIHEDRSESTRGEGVVTDDEHNKNNQIKESNNADAADARVTEYGGDFASENAENANSVSQPSPARPPAQEFPATDLHEATIIWKEVPVLISENTPFDAMTLRQRARVVMAFYMAVIKGVEYCDDLVKGFEKVMSKGASAESLIRAMWFMHHNDFCNGVGAEYWTCWTPEKLFSPVFVRNATRDYPIDRMITREAKERASSFQYLLSCPLEGTN